MYLIYLHRNLINNKVYIGMTCNTTSPNTRWRNGKGYCNQPFYKDIQKYGWDNFEHIIIENNIPTDKINERENYWIKYYNADNPQFGYNGRTSSTVNDLTRQHMKEGWHKNPQRKKQVSAQITQLNKTINRCGENNSMYGTKRIGKEAARKRKVQCLETGKIFETLTDASAWCNPNGSNLRSHIAQQIQGKRKSCGKHPETGVPLHWKYIDNEMEAEYHEV